MTTSETLPKPCPFCGETPLLIKKDERGWFVYCGNFLCTIQRYGSATKQDAIDNWNRRQ
jgi:Lar family restriction alleviation protein